MLRRAAPLFARGWRDDARELLSHTHIEKFQLAAVRMGLVDGINRLLPRCRRTPSSVSTPASDPHHVLVGA